jgi:hypothetical protein
VRAAYIKVSIYATRKTLGVTMTTGGGYSTRVIFNILVGALPPTE